jgi:4-hydroxybenzoate polyprenyltransferase
MKLIKYFNIPDLLILAIALLVFKTGFLDSQAVAVQALNYWQYLLFILATVLVAAGGFFMNNLFSVGKDANPDITEAKGYNIYIALNVAGIGLAWYLGNALGQPMLLTGTFMIAAGTMYFYANGLKQMLIVSNILVALLIALPIVLVALYQLYPLIGVASIETQQTVVLLFKVLLDYIVFAFTIGLLLTFVNDLTQTDADYNSDVTTLPILAGRARTIKIVLGLAVVPVGMVLYYADAHLLDLTYALAYVLLFVLGLLAYFMLKLFHAKTARDFKHLEWILKLVLLFAAFSIMVVTYNIHYAK